MSKKKAFSGNTMTLKDFHGGSIPSDLPLPSAPGVTVRPSDRSGYDRMGAWGSSMGRGDHRSRPNSSPAPRHFDDKTPFLSHTVPIGRNFDEDERKPLDGMTAPRRAVSDDSFWVPSSRLELKPQGVASVGRALGQQGPQVFPLPGQNSGSNSGRVAASVGSTSVGGGSSVSGVPGSLPNAWGIRKEAPACGGEPAESAWSASNAASKLVNASAIDKVSSGRWHSKQSSQAQYQVDTEVMKHMGSKSGFDSKVYDNVKSNRVEVMAGSEYYDVALPRHVEQGLNISEGTNNGRMVEDRVINSEASQLAQADVKFHHHALQHPVVSEASERPKLKLLPRTKPLENPELTVVDHKQVYQRPMDSGHLDFTNEIQGSVNFVKHAPSGMESGSQAVERPKLNLKPRSQPVEQLEESSERDRSQVFGGARPRELVLKDRGVDDVSIIHSELGQSSDRTKHTVPINERLTANAVPALYGEKNVNPTPDQRHGKKFDRKDPRADDRNDPQRRNWRNDNRRNVREADRQQPHHQQQEKERPPSPETWRKPVEEPKPVSPQAGVRFGKAASALELAQAFSRSFSAPPKAAEQFSNQRGIPSQGQVPFSRLVGPASRAQINGY